VKISKGLRRAETEGKAKLVKTLTICTTIKIKLTVYLTNANIVINQTRYQRKNAGSARQFSETMQKKKSFGDH
jgi:hypothetical protein